MNKGLIAGIGILIVGFIFTLFTLFIVIYNNEIALRNRFNAQKMVVENTMDNMRKTLINNYKINSEFSETFIKVVLGTASGRSGGSIFKSVTEASGNINQGFTPELANKMMNSIEGKMSEFKSSQQLMIDIYREHKTYCQTMPRNFFIGNKVMQEPLIISSEISKKAMSTGILEDNMF